MHTEAQNGETMIVAKKDVESSKSIINNGNEQCGLINLQLFSHSRYQ